MKHDELVFEEWGKPLEGGVDCGERWTATVAARPRGDG